MHPAHVPLEPEAEPADVRRTRHAGPRGRFLGGGDHARLTRVQQLVELLQERNRFEILASAEAVRHPLALLARVVEVQHRRHGVDAQPVDVVLAQPEERVREQEVLHLGATEVEDVRAPVRMVAASRVVVLVERGAVEALRAPMDRLRSARGPSRGSRRCRSRADGRRSSGSRRASPSSRRSRRSSSPGSPTSPAYGWCITGSSSTCVNPRSVTYAASSSASSRQPRPLPPRRRVHLVDRHRPLERLLRAPRVEPVGVEPLVLALEDDRRGLRRQLLLERERIGLLTTVEMELVALTCRRAVDDAFPDARCRRPASAGRRSSSSR